MYLCIGDASTVLATPPTQASNVVRRSRALDTMCVASAGVPGNWTNLTPQSCYAKADASGVSHVGPLLTVDLSECDLQNLDVVREGHSPRE